MQTATNRDTATTSPESSVDALTTWAPGPQSANPPPDQAVDALAAWEASAGGLPPATLATVRLDEGDKDLIPFTTSMVSVRLHYSKLKALPGYLHCLGESDCPLCRIGRPVDSRDLLPVYDPDERAVAVLPVSPNVRPQALRPQLVPVLKRVQTGERLAMVVRRVDQYRFDVAAHPLPEGVDDGSEVIAAFTEAVEAGTVRLSDAYPRTSAEVLRAIPEVAEALKRRGLT
jgi:hypothetical protein